jgi:hypothetical protein
MTHEYMPLAHRPISVCALKDLELLVYEALKGLELLVYEALKGLELLVSEALRGLEALVHLIPSVGSVEGGELHERACT